MHFAVKFICPGAGEWWDNNRGRNFEVEFRRRRRQVPNNVANAWGDDAMHGMGNAGVGMLGASSAAAAVRNTLRMRKDARRTERTKRKQEEWCVYIACCEPPASIC